MHILVVNDDGVPSSTSPFVASLVRELQRAGHVVSVVLPDRQRSGISKAHFVGQLITATPYRPATELPSSDPANAVGPPLQDADDWILVDGTPATCVQIGLYHFFQHRGPVDLVVAGPNYGRNVSSLLCLSSGTLGGALEAACCGRRAIAVSYAYANAKLDAAVTAAASRRSVQLIEALVAQWPDDHSVDVYNVNLPHDHGVETAKVLWLDMLQNYFGPRSGYVVLDKDEADKADKNHEPTRQLEGITQVDSAEKSSRTIFKWESPFEAAMAEVVAGPRGNDASGLQQGNISLTPLKANFWHSGHHLHGTEFQL